MVCDENAPVFNGLFRMMNVKSTVIFYLEHAAQAV